MLKFEWPIVTGFSFWKKSNFASIKFALKFGKIHLPILLLRPRTADDLLQILYKFNLKLFSPK